jgi:hypothetical protein
LWRIGAGEEVVRGIKVNRRARLQNKDAHEENDNNASDSFYWWHKTV